MKALLDRNVVFGWIALGTGLVLLIPLIAMQFTSEVNWGVGDFLVMGLLLSGGASLFVLAARRSTGPRRVIVGAAIAAAVLYVWAELAVGLFTNLGS